MIEQIAQLATIIASIFVAFSWLMNFLQKKFTQFRNDLLRVQEKMDNRVTQQQCKERRAMLPCCIGDGMPKCPIPDDQTKKLSETLEKLNITLDNLEKRG